MGHVTEQFENSWLSRYPRPNRCIYDNGKEFVGSDFVKLLAKMGIKDVCTAVLNQQSNAICEQMHQTIGDILGVVLHTNPPQNTDDTNQVINNTLATAMHATRCAVSAPIRTTPGIWMRLATWCFWRGREQTWWMQECVQTVDHNVNSYRKMNQDLPQCLPTRYLYHAPWTPWKVDKSSRVIFPGPSYRLTSLKATIVIWNSKD